MAKREEVRAGRDAWRGYVDLALGFTEASRKQATKTVRRLVGRGEATAEQVHVMAEELLASGLANRESLIRLVRSELDRALERVGLVRADDIVELREQIRKLEDRLNAAFDGGAGSTAPATSASAGGPSAPVAQPEPTAAKPAPRKSAPVKAAKSVPAKAAKVVPAKAGAVTSAKAAPAKAAAGKATPAKAVTVKATPAKAAPAKAVTVKAAPSKAAPSKATRAPRRANGATPSASDQTEGEA